MSPRDQETQALCVLFADAAVKLALEPSYQNTEAYAASNAALKAHLAAPPASSQEPAAPSGMPKAFELPSGWRVERGSDEGTMLISDAAGRQTVAKAEPDKFRTIPELMLYGLAKALLEGCIAARRAAPQDGSKAPAADARFQVHVAGPDDIMPFPDELSAHRCANDINQQYLADRLKHPDNEVLCIATVQQAPEGQP